MSDRIPPVFHSDEHDAPFSHCCRCERAVVDLAEPYVISKQFDRDECVLEFALCQTCHLQVSSEMSIESRTKMKEFLESNADLDARSEELADAPVSAWIRTCVTCGSAPGEDGAYSLGGMVAAGSFLFDPYPLMMCSSCQKRVENTLSAQTKDRWDKFISDHFDGPPADAETPPRRTPMLL